jgi:A/G-specific adenine glycosylase
MPLAANSNIKNQKSKLIRLVPALLDWFSRNARDLPWRSRKTGRDPYAIWVSEIMLQQTQVKTVLPYWKRWMRELPAIEALAQATPEKIHKLWEGLGYYTRVRNLQKAARLILEKHGGKFPECFDDVLALPGIGRYTAGAICSIAFNQPAPVLDGNVIRVLTRVFGIARNPREKKTNALLWKIAGLLVCESKIKNQKSKTACSHLNQSLMELGALVCTPRQPACQSCPVSALCSAFQQNRTDELPNIGKRPAVTARPFAAFILKNQGRFLVRQRPGGVVNAHLWEFPNIELTGTRNLREAARTALGFTPRSLKPLCAIKHTITRYRITLTAFTVGRNHKAGHAPFEGRWLKPPELRKLSFPSAHKKILAHLESGFRNPRQPRHSAHRIGVGMAWLAPPLPPNRTGGFPASGSPVSGSHF